MLVIPAWAGIRNFNFIFLKLINPGSRSRRNDGLQVS